MWRFVDIKDVAKYVLSHDAVVASECESVDVKATFLSGLFIALVWVKFSSRKMPMHNCKTEKLPLLIALVSNFSRNIWSILNCGQSNLVNRDRKLDDASSIAQMIPQSLFSSLFVSNFCVHI